eukprot:6481606-Prymnesium_polylepis.1
MVEERAANLLAVRRALASIFNGRICRGFRSWRATVQRRAQASSQFTAAQRAVGRLQHQQLARALSTW